MLSRLKLVIAAFLAQNKVELGFKRSFCIIMASTTGLKSQRGAPLLTLDRYVYRKRSTVRSTTYWRCIRECKATVIESAGSHRKGKALHNHEPDHQTIRSLNINNKIKACVREDPTEKPSDIYKKIRTELDENLFITEREKTDLSFSTLRSKTSLIYREKYKQIPRNQDLNLLNEESEFAKIDGHNFLIINEVGAEMLVFSTDDFVKHLCEAKKILMDGTFYTSPTDFTQLYTIHTKISGQVFPVLYALLPNKTELTYVRLLRKIKIYATNLGLTFQPAIVQIDFEKAAMNSVYSVFGNNGVQVKGCLFHYCQALFRKVQNLGLSEAYGQEDSEIRKTIKRCFALSLVRAEDFDMAWELIAGNAPPDVTMTRFLDYMTDT